MDPYSKKINVKKEQNILKSYKYTLKIKVKLFYLILQMYFMNMEMHV